MPVFGNEKQLYHKWSAEDLHYQLPYLSLGQLHSALAHYWDHREDLDRDITRRFTLCEQLQRQALMPPLRELLRERGEG